jgi:flavin reductase (DIM6/NTAB) family NADH-FMN oxidoreductase RutF
MASYVAKHPDPDDLSLPGVDSRHLRRSVGQFVTGVTVVTYDIEGGPRGVTVNSFTSVSMDPPLKRAPRPGCPAHRS